MTSVDELFKRPGLPLTSHKRKLEASDAQEVYKAAKIEKNASPNGRANGATVEDAEEDDDVEAGPELPPDDEGDDEDGRFFGTGVTRDTAEAIDYIEQQEEDDEDYQPERIDSAWLRRLATTFERKVSKNAELRARYENDPQKFMASEADLDAEVKSWSVLSDHPELYAEFIESGCAASLVGLLAHENTDIAIGAIEILSELLDEDVQVEQEQFDALVEALFEADLLELLMSNIRRLREDNESDRSGVYHSLAVMEKLASQRSTAERVGREEVLTWLCNRIKEPEKPLSQNKQYAAEVMQVLLQSSPLLRRRLAVDVEGVDLFLQLLAGYRKRDPAKDSVEEEYAENLFDALTCVVDEVDGKSKFLEAEGVELMLIMLRESSKTTAQRALRVLDHAVGGQSKASADLCEKVVHAAGLKPIFSMIMKKTDSANIEHLLGILSALLRSLPGESAERIRTLAKFTEKDCEKVTKLEQLRQEYTRRVRVVEQEIEGEQKGLSKDEIEERSDEWFSRRLDGGLFCLQMIDVIMAWLIAEDPKMKKKLLDSFGDEKGFGAIRTSLEEQRNGLDTNTAEDEDTKDMLDTLIGFLE